MSKRKKQRPVKHDKNRAAYEHECSVCHRKYRVAEALIDHTKNQHAAAEGVL